MLPRYIFFLFFLSCTAKKPSDNDIYITAPTDGEMNSFVEKYRAARVGQNLDSSDEQLIFKVKTSSPKNQLTEAVLFLAVIKKVLATENIQKMRIEDVEVLDEHVAIPSRNAKGVRKKKRLIKDPTQLSLESVSKEFDIAFTEVLEKNTLVKLPSVFAMAAKANQLGQNSTEFQTRMRKVLEQEINTWKNIAVLTSELPFDPVENNQIEIQKVSPKVASNDEATLIKDSVHLSEIGQFDTALLKLKAIPNDSPHYVYAVDRIKQISNQGASELRKKAASEYQSAQGISDPKVKSNFLERAKKYLQEALDKYPDSDQKKTILENMSMIEREIRR